MNHSVNLNADNILVSVLMITYNHEKFIEKAIQAVLAQETKFAVQLLICNDASTDQTDEIVESCILRNSSLITIKYEHHHKNLGMMQNFKMGLELCTGKYIALCEGDDYWTDPLKLQKQVDFLEANPQLAGCFSDAIAVDTMGNKLRDALLPEHKKQVGIQNIGNFWMPTLSVCFKREYLTHVLNANRVAEVYNGDMLLYYTISQHGDFGYVQTEPSCYREHSGGVWSRVKIIERYRRNLISDFIIYDILLPENKQHMLARIEANLQWQLNHYRSHEHISEIPKFLKQNVKQLLQRKRYREAVSLLSCTLPVLASRTRQKLTRQ